MTDQVPKITWPRTVGVSLIAVLVMWAAAWALDYFRHQLAARGFIIHDLVFMLALLTVMVGAFHLVAGRLLRDIRAQIQARSAGK